MTLNDTGVLVVGSAGFVGSHLVEQLIREKVREIVVQALIKPIAR